MAKKFMIERGSKGTGDKIIRVWSYGDVFTIEDILRILDVIFRSEDSYYPKPQYQGSCMLMKAILEVYSGFPVEKVLENYKLSRKTSKTVIVEKVDSEPSVKPIEKLHEIIGA